MSGETEISRTTYFHGMFNSIEEVLQTMMPYLKQNGHFLLRRSQSRPNGLTISVTDNSTVKHFSIQSNSGMYSIDDRTFTSIENLCNFYKWNDVPNVEGYKHVRLLHPIRSPSFLTRIQLNSPDNDDVFSDRPFQNILTMTLKSSPKGQNRRKLSLPTVTYNQSHGFTLYENQNNRPITDTVDRDENYPMHNRLITDTNYPLHTQTLPKDRKDIQNNNDHSFSTNNISNNSNDSKRRYRNNSNDDNNNNDSPYYSTPRKRETNVLNGVLEQLKRLESSDLCVCGLPISDTELPHGWSVHLSTEPETTGRMFYTSPDGNTSWKLPSHIRHHLTPSQKDFIKLLKQNNNKSSVSSPACSQEDQI